MGRVWSSGILSSVFAGTLSSYLSVLGHRAGRQYYMPEGSQGVRMPTGM